MRQNSYDLDDEVDNREFLKSCHESFHSEKYDLRIRDYDEVNQYSTSDPEMVDSNEVKVDHADKSKINGLFTFGCGPCVGFIGINRYSGEYFVGHSSHGQRTRIGDYGEDYIAKEAIDSVEHLEAGSWEVRLFTGDAKSEIEGIPGIICTYKTFEKIFKEVENTDLENISITAVEEKPGSLGGEAYEGRSAARIVKKGEYGFEIGTPRVSDRENIV